LVAAPADQEIRGDTEKKSFHSFRKTSANDLKDAGVASELRADILGHGGKNITEERYASSSKLKQVLEALEKLPDFTSHLAAHEGCKKPRIYRAPDLVRAHYRTM
jgi:integrase